MQENIGHESWRCHISTTLVGADLATNQCIKSLEAPTHYAVELVSTVPTGH